MFSHGFQVLLVLFSGTLLHCCRAATMSEVFDYIIVGGGQSGLAIASRLSENSSLTVLVLEAGGSGINNPGISIPGLIGTTLGTDIDWKYSTVPQKEANERKIYYPRGKVLGGSSAVNFIISTKADQDDYNAIEKLGNPGWGWSEIDRASKKREKLLIPKPGSRFIFNPQDHGTSGPVTNSFPKYIPPQFEPYFPAAVAASIDGGAIQSKDPFGGQVEGAYYYPSAIDSQSTRVTSATAYYFPIQSRANLVVRTGAEVNKLITQQAEGSAIKISGVEYSSSGTLSRAGVKKEVIMCAGTIGTPAILERSGIGKQDILSSLNIPVVLNLEGVGGHLSDHPAVLGTYRLKPGIVSADDLRNATFAAEQMSIYQTTKGGLLSHALSLLDYRSLKSILTENEIKEGFALLKRDPNTMSADRFDTIVERIKNGVAVEFLLINAFFESDNAPEPNTSYLTIATTLQHPLSRGSSHIKSQDPSEAPLIDPGFFSHPFDSWLMAKAAKHARKILSQPEWAAIIRDEKYPGPSVQSDKEWLESIKKRVRTEYHPLGTSSMMPREKSGVVDPELRVYGTQNLRVADASILPIQIGGHPSMTVYAIAEKAAEIVLKLNDS